MKWVQCNESVSNPHTNGGIPMSKRTIEAVIDDVSQSIEVPVRVEELVARFQPAHSAQIVAAIVNNELKELSFKLDEACTSVKFIDLTSEDGIRIYQRSLTFIFIRATMEIFYGCKVKVHHSLSKGLYCEFDYNRSLAPDDIAQIRQRMQEIIDRNEPFLKETVSTEVAIRLFNQHGMESKEKLMKYRRHEYIHLYNLGWLRDYFYGYMVPSTGYIKLFGLIHYDNGVILQHPTKYSPESLPEFEEHKQLARIYSEAEEWAHILDISYVANLNELIESNRHGELIQVAEALHEKKVGQIADMITAKGARVVLIAGPSSSGKTTFAHRLMVQLRVNGLRPITLSTDDYFVDREKTPLDDEGNYDFESVLSVNVEQFNDILTRLLAGEAVSMPVFNFKLGKQEFPGRILQIAPNQPIIIEGIHGLNDRLTAMIPKNEKFKVYISALTSLNVDDHNRIPTTDTRLIRRIVRDSKYRGHSAKRTISMWPSVRRGEERNIFPFQESADAMFNSALPYELAVLKRYADPLLREIKENEPEYSEAKRLLKFLHYFLVIEDESLIVQTSILKEFIGGSCFHDQQE